MEKNTLIIAIQFDGDPSAACKMPAVSVAEQLTGELENVFAGSNTQPQDEPWSWWKTGGPRVEVESVKALGWL